MQEFKIKNRISPNNHFKLKGVIFMKSSFIIKVGNTERDAQTIVKEIKRSALPIEQVEVKKTVQDIELAVSLSDTNINEEELKQRLNEQGGCMYQVVEVTKV